MLKKIIAFVLIILAIYWSFSALMPNTISNIDTKDNLFSTQRALVHLKEISKAPHYVGSKEHGRVRNYIIDQLESLGLTVDVQSGYSYNKKWGSITQPKNILARIKGTDNTKALMLLTHYDTNPHSAIGASDAGSGVVTILEGLRAYLNTGKRPKNDIIVLISDAEELGLNGASLFVNNHPWAKDVGLVLNFEARGSGGPSYMLIETNGGNHNLIEAFKSANPEFPVANSLAYSVYKKLPNDTDLTRFREDADIDGFNFAFIDDHFDYHTIMDNYDRLDRKTLEHQGSYLMPLLQYFSDADLNSLKSNTDDVFFNAPVLKLISYPNTWILPMLILAILLFLVLLFYGFNKRRLNAKQVALGFVPAIGSLLINGLIGFYGWKLLLALYPRYGEILHGFTYNGHTYILAFAMISIAICMWMYHKVYKPENTASLLIAPTLLWLLLSGFAAFYLKGASFFIVPVFFALISLFILIRQKKPNLILMALLLFPLLTITIPFTNMLPVGLGLKLLSATTILVSLIFGLCLTVFGFLRHKKRWAYLFLIVAIISFGIAHQKSNFSDTNPKPNSLVYLYDTDTNKAVWATYDHLLDNWTKKYLTETPNIADASLPKTIASKYATKFSFYKPTSVKSIVQPIIEIKKDTIIEDKRHQILTIHSQRMANRMEIFADTTLQFYEFKVNGLDIPKTTGTDLVFEKRKNNRLFTYAIADDHFLTLEFTTPKNQQNTFTLLEASFDLLDNPLFDVPKRENYMIPKPFVLNDAIIIKKTIKL